VGLQGLEYPPCHVTDGMHCMALWASALGTPVAHGFTSWFGCSSFGCPTPWQPSLGGWGVWSEKGGHATVHLCTSVTDALSASDSTEC
jgi:hypothetical protein